MKKAPRQSEVIRKEWPRVTAKRTATGDGWKIDARRKDTNGRAEFRADRAEALARAAEIAAEYAANGTEGLALPADLRFMAFKGDAILKPHGKTVLQACEFYRDYLKTEQDKEASALIPTLADEWLKDKQDKKHKLKPKTLNAIRQTANLLKSTFPAKRIKAFTKADAEKFIFTINGEYQQEGTRNRCGQFFNWCIAKEYGTANPFSSKLLTVTLPEVDIEIFDSATTEKVLELCEAKHKDLIPYVAVCFFAGLRPGEAEQLTWEHIHLEEGTIHVLGSTSKAGVTHNVDIEANLAEWLEKYRPADAKGLICPTGKTLARKRQLLHADLGYKAAGKNQEAAEITQDVMRHSYASHWQAKYTNAHKLAELMANSVEVIRDHYKKVVSKKEIEAYWSIKPEIATRREGKHTFAGQDVRAIRLKRLAEAVAV